MLRMASKRYDRSNLCVNSHDILRNFILFILLSATTIQLVTTYLLFPGLAQHLEKGCGFI